MIQAADGSAIVVTGTGAVTALGLGSKRLVDGVLAGESGLRGGIGECRSFKPEDHLGRRDVRNLDRGCQFGVVAAAQAIEAALWHDEPPCAPEGIACVMGTALGGLAVAEGELERFRTRGARSLSPRAFTKAMANSVGAALGVRYGWRGESQAVVAGCASGLQAVVVGARLLQCGAAQAVAVGGVEASLTDYFCAAYEAFGATSKRGTCRPFDRTRDGISLGEGAGVLLLETECGATARGATPLATLSGLASTSDGYHVATPHPEGVGLVRALTTACAQAGVSAAELGYINAHGSGSIVGDQVEASAIMLALGPENGVPVSSVKASIGHAQGAAGAVELIATIGALRRGLAPPSVGLSEPDVGMDLAFVRDKPRQIPSRQTDGELTGASVSFGLGGHNAVAVLRADTRMVSAQGQGVERRG